VRGRIGTLLVLLVLVAVCVRSIRQPEDFAGYVAVGEAVLAGEHIYHATPKGLNTWPPVFSLVCVPLALLDRPSAYLGRGVWLLAGLLALLSCLHVITRLVHRRPLTLDPPRRPGLPLYSPEVLLPLLLAHVAVVGNFIHLQVNTMVFLLVLVALRAQARGRPLAGGIALGVAGALRVMPLVFVPYLLWRRRWKPAAVALATSVVVSLLPILVFGVSQFGDYVTSWRAATGRDAIWGVGHMNQSMPATWDRYLGHGVVPFRTEPQHDIEPSDSSAAHLATLVTLAVTAALALWRFRGRVRPAGRAALLEWSIVFLVGASFGPVSWKAYLIVLLLPYALITALLRETGTDPAVRTLARVLLVVACLFLALPTRDLLGRELSRHLEMGGVFAIGSVLLLAGMFRLHALLAAAETGGSASEPRSGR